MYDILAVGDSTIDVFLFLNEASVQCELEKDTCRLCINYADKIPVEKMARVDGVGNAANHAVGAARLGLKTAIFTIVGHDLSGHAIRKKLSEEGVSTRYIAEDKKRGSNYSTVIDYKGERTILVYHEQRDYAWPKLPKSRWLYLTSMGAGHEAMYNDAARFISQSKTQVAFNPGTFQLKLGKDVLRPILSVSRILFVNKEEAKRLVGSDVADMKELLSALATLGPRIVVVTDGQKGSYCFDGSAVLYLPIFEAPVVERTGCGDAYGSGFVAALAYGRDVREAMRWGSMNAAGVIQYIGAQEGLLRKDDMERRITEHPEYQPVRMAG